MLDTANARIAPEFDLNVMSGKAKIAADFLKTMSHESRLLLLCILTKGETSVGELEQMLGERQSTVSQQLARLRLDHLVTTRRDGKTIYYSLASNEVRVMLNTLYSLFCSNDC